MRIAAKNSRRAERCNMRESDERYYIQSALSVADPDKKEQEIASLISILDSFKIIVVVRDYMNPWRDENGIQNTGIEDFFWMRNSSLNEY